MDGCDVGNGIVQIGAGKEVLKLAKKKFLTTTSGQSALNKRFGRECRQLYTIATIQFLSSPKQRSSSSPKRTEHKHYIRRRQPSLLRSELRCSGRLSWKQGPHSVSVICKTFDKWQKSAICLAGRPRLDRCTLIQFKQVCFLNMTHWCLLYRIWNHETKNHEKPVPDARNLLDF